MIVVNGFNDFCLDGGENEYIAVDSYGACK